MPEIHNQYLFRIVHCISCLVNLHIFTKSMPKMLPKTEFAYIYHILLDQARDLKCKIIKVETNPKQTKGQMVTKDLKSTSFSTKQE